MWSTISKLKNNITAIASDVLDTTEELESDVGYSTPYDSATLTSNLDSDQDDDSEDVSDDILAGVPGNASFNTKAGAGAVPASYASLGQTVVPLAAVPGSLPAVDSSQVESSSPISLPGETGAGHVASPRDAWTGIPRGPGDPHQAATLNWQQPPPAHLPGSSQQQVNGMQQEQHYGLHYPPRQYQHVNHAGGRTWPGQGAEAPPSAAGPVAKQTPQHKPAFFTGAHSSPEPAASAGPTLAPHQGEVESAQEEARLAREAAQERERKLSEHAVTPEATLRKGEGPPFVRGTFLTEAQQAAQDLQKELEQARGQAARAEQDAVQLREQLRRQQLQQNGTHDAQLAELQDRLREAELRGSTLAAELADLRTQVGQERERHAGELRLRECGVSQREQDWAAQHEGEVRQLREQHEAAQARLAGEKEKLGRDLGRLKQHLLNIETEESEKAEVEAARTRGLERTILEQQQQMLALQERVARLSSSLEAAGQAEASAGARAAQQVRGMEGELEALREEHLALQAERDAKEEELGNLQAALGAFYAESEAKNNLAAELRTAREETVRLARELEESRAASVEHKAAAKEAQDRAEEAEERVGIAREKQKKWEEETGRLRKALDESMMRLNQLSTDSGFYVDRRIVVKLLLTYFERQHSKEALDLMVRMLGFSEDEKRRIGEAARLRNAGGGVVRGVLNLPGKLVGGLLSGGMDHAPPAENQQRAEDGPATFSDLWIEFLLRESEERDRQNKNAAELQRRASERGMMAPAPAGSAGSALGPSSPRNDAPGIQVPPPGAASGVASARSPGASPPRYFSSASAPRQASPSRPPDSAMAYNLTSVHRSRTPSPTPMSHDPYFHQQQQPLGSASMGGNVGEPGSTAAGRTLSSSSPPRGTLGGPLPPTVPFKSTNSASSPMSTSLAVKTSRQGSSGAGRGAYGSRVNGVAGVSRLGEGDDSSDASGGDFSPVPLHGNSSGEGPSLFDSFRRVNKNKDETPLAL